MHDMLYRGSYMSAHVLLNLLNKLRKSDKMRGLPSILSLFRNTLNKFNNTGARILDSIYSHDIKIALNLHFWCENVNMLPSISQRGNGHHYVLLPNL